MKIISVNVGKPKSYHLDGVTLDTSMVKSSQNQIHVNTASIDGDEFKGISLHGTIDAVVYALSSKVYTYYSDFCGKSLPAGYLGENLTLDNLDESDVYLGDEFQCGGVQIKVTGVRYPCNRLNFVTGNQKMRDEFLNKDWPGIYFEVLVPGTIKPYDDLILKNRIQKHLTALDLYKAIRAAERKTITDSQFNELISSPHLMQKYKDRLYKKTGREKPPQ